MFLWYRQTVSLRRSAQVEDFDFRMLSRVALFGLTVMNEGASDEVARCTWLEAISPCMSCVAPLWLCCDVLWMSVQ